MGSLKHVWAGAFVLATLLTCVLAASGEAAIPGPINDDASTANLISFVLEFWLQFINSSEVQAVPPVEPDTLLGRIDMYDVALTNTSDPNSTEVGRGYATLFLESSGYENKVTLVFNNNSGLPANSSINLEGFEPYNLPPAGYNYSVVGGTGGFACARGVITDILGFSNATAASFHDFAYFVVGCGFRRSNAFYLFGSPEP